MSRADFRVKLTLEARVSPSEDRGKVADALRKVVGGAPASVSSGEAVSLSTVDNKALAFIRDQLRDRHVRSAARRQLLLSRRGDTTSLMLNRQAAAAGVVAICGSPEESPLGPIYLTIESEELDAAVDWLAPYPEG